MDISSIKLVGDHLKCFPSSLSAAEASPRLFPSFKATQQQHVFVHSLVFPRGFLWGLDFAPLAGTGDAAATWDPLPTNPGLKEDVGRERAARLLSGCALDGPVAVSCLS